MGTFASSTGAFRALMATTPTAVGVFAAAFPSRASASLGTPFLCGASFADRARVGNSETAIATRQLGTPGVGVGLIPDGCVGIQTACHAVNAGNEKDSLGTIGITHGLVVVVAVAVAVVAAVAIHDFVGLIRSFLGRGETTGHSGNAGNKVGLSVLACCTTTSSTTG